MNLGRQGCTGTRHGEPGKGRRPLDRGGTAAAAEDSGQARARRRTGPAAQGKSDARGGATPPQEPTQRPNPPNRGMVGAERGSNWPRSTHPDSDRSFKYEIRVVCCLESATGHIRRPGKPLPLPDWLVSAQVSAAIERLRNLDLDIKGGPLSQCSSELTLMRVKGRLCFIPTDSVAKKLRPRSGAPATNAWKRPVTLNWKPINCLVRSKPAQSQLFASVLRSGGGRA